VRSTGQVINGINDVNILNTGRGTVDSAGNVTVTLSAIDTAAAVMPNISQYEVSMYFTWTFDSGTKTGRHQASFMLVVPQA
jgi:hypothetical protein